MAIMRADANGVAICIGPYHFQGDVGKMAVYSYKNAYLNLIMLNRQVWMAGVHNSLGIYFRIDRAVVGHGYDVHPGDFCGQGQR